ncbi:unnamed protein product, partial [Pylaiella littoralis]
LVTQVQPLGGGLPSFYQASAQASDIDRGVDSDLWFRRLDRRQAQVQSMLPPAPDLPLVEL